MGAASHVCPKCGKQTKNMGQLEMHLAWKHDKSIESKLKPVAGKQ